MIYSSKGNQFYLEFSKPSFKRGFGSFLLLIWLLFSFGQIQAQLPQKRISTGSIGVSSINYSKQANLVKSEKPIPSAYFAEILDEEIGEEDEDSKEELRAFLTIYYKCYLATYIHHEQTRFAEINAAVQQIQTLPLFVLHKSFKHFLS